MINTPTVFVLGAGASKSYGLPDGKMLLSFLKNKLDSKNIFEDYVSWTGRGVAYFPDEMRVEINGFKKALEDSDPKSIDEFLSFPKNEKYVRLGKYLIASIICERDSAGDNAGAAGVGDNWYQLLKAKMLQGTQSKLENFIMNKISFITFNYDATLEEYFTKAVTSNWGEEFIDHYFNAIPHIHVHGCLKSRKPKEGNWDLSFGEKAFGPEQIGKIASNIKLVHETDNYSGKNDALGLISNAKNIVFLGFGFHENNILKLGFKDHPNILSNKAYFATVSGMSSSEQEAAKERLGKGVLTTSNFDFINGTCSKFFSEFENVIR